MRPSIRTGLVMAGLLLVAPASWCDDPPPPHHGGWGTGQWFAFDPHQGHSSYGVQSASTATATPATRTLSVSASGTAPAYSTPVQCLGNATAG